MPDDKKDPLSIQEQLYSIDWDTVDVGPSNMMRQVNWESIEVTPPSSDNDKERVEIPWGPQVGGSFTKGLADVVVNMLGGAAVDLWNVIPTTPGELVTSFIPMTKSTGASINLLRTFFPSWETGKDIEDAFLEYKHLGDLGADEEAREKLEQVKRDLKIGTMEVAKDVSGWIDEAIPTDDQAGFWMSDLPQGFGSMTGFMLATLLAKGKGVSPGIIAALMGSEAEGFGLMQEAHDITKNLELAEDAGQIGKIIGLSEGIPIATMFNKFEKLTSPAANNLLKKTLAKYFGGVAGRRTGEIGVGMMIQGMEEAIQEMGQQFASNLTAKEMYDFNRDLMEGVTTGGAVGLITGSVMGGLGLGMTLIKNKMTPQEIEVAQKVYKETLDKFKGVTDNLSTLGQVTNGLGAVYNMGKEGAITFEGLEQADDDAGRGNVQAHFGSIIKETIKELEQGGGSPNIIDGVMKLGNLALKVYLDGANAGKGGKEYFSQAIDQEMIDNLKPEQLKDMTNNMFFKAISVGMEKGMGGEFEQVLKGINESVRKEAVRDLVAATVLDFGASGYYLLGEKYKGLGNAVNKLIEISQNLKENSKYKNVIDSDGEIFLTSIDPVARSIQRNKIKAVSETIKNTLQKEDHSINAILEKEEGPAGDEEMMRPLDDATNEELAKRLAQKLGYKFEGTLKSLSGNYYQFTDPRSGSTYGVFGEQLNESDLSDLMEGHLEEYKAVQKAREPISEEPDQIDEDIRELAGPIKFRLGKASVNTVGERVEGFKGETVREFYEFLKRENMVPKEWKMFFENNILPIVGELPLKVRNFYGNSKERQAHFRWNIKPKIGRPEAKFSERLIEINASKPLFNEHKPFMVMLHETLHGWTSEFLKAGRVKGDPKALRFYQQMDQLRKYFKNVLEEKGDRSIPRTAIDWALLKSKIDGDPALSRIINTMKGSVDEFIAYALAGDPKVLSVMNDILWAESTKTPAKAQNLFDRFIEHLQELLASTFGIDLRKDSILNELASIMSVYELDLADFSKGGRKGIYATDHEYRKLHGYHMNEDPNTLDHDLVEQLDEGQEDDDQGEKESVREELMVNSFSQFVATLMGVDISIMYATLKNSTPSYVSKTIEKLDEKYNGLVETKLKALYDRRYKGYIEGYEVFKASMITRLLNRAQEVSHKKMYSFGTFFNRRYKRDGSRQLTTDTSYRMTALGDTHKDSSGKTSSTLHEDIVLEEFIPDLEEALGSPEGTIEIGFIKTFDTFQMFGGKNRTKVASANRTRLSSGDWLVGKKKTNEASMSAFLANKINKAKDTVNKKRFIYLGSFADKNTMPILVVNQDEHGKILEALGRFTNYYANIIRNAKEFQYNPSSNLTEETSAVLRAMLEDMWYGVDFKDPNFKSVVALQDWNRDIQKRGTKWVYSKKAIQEDWDHVGDLFASQDGMINPEAYSGITYDKESRKIVVKTAILRTEDKDLLDQTIEIDGEVYNVGKMLINALGDSTTDGASFYILGEFDKVYGRVYGVIKQGALKNVVSSQYDGRGKPLFIKHAMHGLAPSDPLAIWMRKKNIAVLTSDTSAKINSVGTISLNELAGPDELTEGIINLPLSNFHRYKEEQNIAYFSGKSRQAWNGSGFVSANPAVKAADTEGTFDQDLLTLMEKMVTLWVEDNIGNGIDKRGYTLDDAIADVKSIVLEPSSPKEEAIAKILEPLLSMSEELGKESFRNVLNHTLFSNQLNNKLRNRLADVLQMVLPGARVALGPSLGIMAKTSQVDPVTSEQNLRWHLRSLPVNDKVYKAALPDKVLRTWLANLRELQRRVSIYTSKGQRDKAKALHFEINKTYDKMEKRVKQLYKEDPKNKRYRTFLQSRNAETLINMRDPEVETWAASQINKMLNDQGLLNDGWTIITQDVASKYGMKTGDRILAVVTPTDSALSIASVRIAAIVPSHGSGKKMESSKAIFNSEYIQTMVGKDFDIDTISLIPFDPDYWTGKQFENILNVVQRSKEEYISRMVSTVQSLFDEKRDELIKLPGAIQDGTLVKADRKNVFKDEIRILFSQLMNGVRTDINKEKHAILGNDFHFINDAYVADVSKIITARLYHSIVSALGIKSTMAMPLFDAHGNIIEVQNIKLEARHRSWFRTHMLHLIMTNHILDFPSNTSLLHYKADMDDPVVQRKMFQHMWGISKERFAEMRDSHVDAINTFIRLIFGRALQLAKLQAEDGNTATHFELIQGIEDQKLILRLLENGETESLKEFFQAHVDGELESYLQSRQLSAEDIEAANIDAKEKVAVVNAFIDSMELEDSVFKYPLFTLINSIPATAAPHFGLTQKEALKAEVEVGKALAYSSPRVTFLLDKGIYAHVKGQKRTFFKDEELNKIYESYSTIDGDVNADVDSIALSLLAQEQDFQRERHIRPLEQIRRTAIAIIHAIDEVGRGFDKDTPTQDRVRNEQARAKAFPLLFKKLLEKNFVTLVGNQRRVQLKTPEGMLILTVDETGRLLVTDGAENLTFTPEEILDPAEPLERKAKKLLTEEGGVWDSQRNRKGLSDFLKFPDNISLDERREILTDWLTTNLYGNDTFDAEDTLVFWLSFIGQVTNNGLRDKRAINLQVNRSLMDPNRPFTYQYNDMFLTLLTEFEPQLKDSYLYHFNNLVDKQGRGKLQQIINALQQDAPGQSDILFMDDDVMPEGKQLLTDVFYEHLANMKGGFFKASEWKKFKNLVEKEGFDVGLEELRSLYSDLAILMSLNDHGYNVDELVDDLNHMPTRAFRTKYDSLNDPQMRHTFAVHELKAAGKMERAMNLDPSLGTLKQLFYVHYKAKRAWLRKNKLPNKHFAGKLQDEVYAPMRERKTYIFADEDETIGYSMQVASRFPQALTPRRVSIRYKILPNTNPESVGEASLAIKKGEDVDRVLNLHKEEMSIHLEVVEDYINVLKKKSFRKKFRAKKTDDEQLKRLINQLEDSKLSDPLLRRMIFDMAEDMFTKLGVRIVGTNKPGQLFFTHKDANRPYRSPISLLEKHFIDKSAEWKMIFLSALEYRKMYDIRAREVVVASSNYLNQLYEDITSDFSEINEGARYIAQAIKVYEGYLVAIDERIGNYMPHRYPMHVYEEMWKNENAKKIRSGLKAQRKAHQKMRDNGVSGWDPRIADRTDNEIAELIEERLEQAWAKLEKGAVQTAFIPNFQKREIEDPKIGYAKTSSKPHTDYVYRLIEGTKSDLLLADWFLFEKLARSKGENIGVINSVRYWFASQLTNKLLHSRKRAISKVKKGMQVSFIIPGEWINEDSENPIRSELRVAGIVRKITADRIYLYVDPTNAVTEAKRRIVAYDTIHAAIKDIPGGVAATAQQIKYINELVTDGYADKMTEEELSELSVTDANDLIRARLDIAIKNPDKLGSFKRDMIYTRDIDGTMNTDMVDRFQRYGGVEFLEAKAREIRNIKLIQGYWDSPVIDQAKFATYKLSGKGLDFVSTAYRRTMGALILAFLNGPKALFRNAFGLIVSNVSHMPIRATKGMFSGAMEFFHLRKERMDKMSQEQRLIYNTLASLSLARTTSVVKLTLGSLNLNREELLVHKKWYQKVSSAWKLFNQASGYSKFVNKLRILNKEYRLAPAKDKFVIREEILTLKRAWSEKVDTIFESEPDYRPEDTDALLKKLESIDPKEIDLNEAAELGITRKKALLAFGKTVFSTIYEGFPFGIKVQALAEYGRIPTFFHALNLAKENGHGEDINDAIQYAINYVEAYNAFYSPQNKQRDANTKLGRAYLQFVQYQLTLVTTNIKMTQEAIIQGIGVAEPGVKGKLKHMLSLVKQDFVTVKEYSKQLQDKEYVTKHDVNLARAVFVRWVTNAIGWQIGVAGTVMGVQYAIDPFMQAILGGTEMLIDMFNMAVGDEGDEEDIKREIVEGVYETAFLYGVPYKQGLQILLRPDDQSIFDAIVQGRIGSQFGTMERFINTWNVFLDKEDLSKKERKKTIADINWLVDNFTTGFGIIGPKRYIDEESDWTRISMFLGEDDLTFPAHDGIMDEERPWMGPIERLSMLLRQPHRSILPLGHKIFDK